MNDSQLKIRLGVVSIAAFASLLVVGLAISRSTNSQKSSSITSKTQSDEPIRLDSFHPNSALELIITYDTTNKTIKLSKSSIINREIHTDPRETEESLYILQLLTQNNTILYETKVRIMDSIFSEDGNIISSQDYPREIDSYVYIPFYPTASNIKILKGNSIVFESKLEV